MHCTNPDKYYDIESTNITSDKNDSNDCQKYISEEEIVHKPDLVEIEDFSVTGRIGTRSK